jgi:ABC-2 type transport system permease protein
MNFWKITKKDVRLLLRDRRAVFVLIALPLTFISILGLSAGQLFSQKEKGKKYSLGVIDESQSDLSFKLLEEVRKIEALDVRDDLTDLKQAREMLADGKIEVLARIGPRYEEIVQELELSDVFYPEEGKLRGNLRNLDIEVQAGAFLVNAAEIVEKLVFAFAVKTIAPAVLQRTEKGLATRLMTKIKEAKRAAEDRPEEETSITELPPGKSRADVVYQFLVPSYTVMFVFFIVNFMAHSIVSERDTGTLARLLIAPLTRSGLMIGKTVPFLFISLTQTVLLFLCGKVLFQMSWGPHPLMLLPVMLCTSIAATSLGLMVATIVKNDSQVSAYGNFLVLTLAGISGCLMPRSWQPALMQQIGLATPHAWALIAYDQLLNRDLPNLYTVWKCCGTLLLYASGFYLVGWWRFRTLE